MSLVFVGNEEKQNSEWRYNSNSDYDDDGSINAIVTKNNRFWNECMQENEWIEMWVEEQHRVEPFCQAVCERAYRKDKQQQHKTIERRREREVAFVPISF